MKKNLTVIGLMFLMLFSNAMVYAQCNITLGQLEGLTSHTNTSTFRADVQNMGYLPKEDNLSNTIFNCFAHDGKDQIQFSMVKGKAYIGFFTTHAETYNSMKGYILSANGYKFYKEQPLTTRGVSTTEYYYVSDKFIACLYSFKTEGDNTTRYSINVYKKD